MTQQPQFEHKKPGICRWLSPGPALRASRVKAYNAAAGDRAGARGNDVFRLGLMGWPWAHAGAGGGDPGQMGLP
jgi:hypothetical protein